LDDGFNWYIENRKLFAMQELALQLYQAQRITLIQAANLCMLNFFDFQGLLRDRRISQNYGESDFEKDLATIRELWPE
jgi:predicted HTH domain antitoxin